MHVDFLSDAQGGFFLRKKPLSVLLSVYTNSENALGPFSPELGFGTVPEKPLLSELCQEFAWISRQ
jgi:hypothetical protein